MNPEKVQREIDALNYWDSYVMDFFICCFGDEVNVVISDGAEADSNVCTVLKFQQCLSVSYRTDADDNIWRKGRAIKSMRRAQLGYYLQDITVSRSDVDGFLKIEINMILLTVTIHCKDVLFEQRPFIYTDYFWGR